MFIISFIKATFKFDWNVAFYHRLLAQRKLDKMFAN